MNAATKKPDDVEAWNKERRELIKKTCCPKEISDAEFAHFADWCVRLGFDPLRGDCMLQERRVKVKDKDGNEVMQNGKPLWERRLTPMATEAGMSRRAAEFADFRGILGAAVFEGDLVEFDHSKGTVKHTSNPLKRGKVIGAWAVVMREGMQFPIEWCRVEGYAQNSPLWSGIPDTMISKCARSAAWRRAYPGKFSDVYTAEESRHMERVTEGTDSSAPIEAAQSVKDKVKATLAALPASTGAELNTMSESPDTDPLAAEPVADSPAANAAAPAPSPTPPKPDSVPGAVAMFSDLRVTFGEKEGWKGKLAASFKPEQLLEIIAAGNKALAAAKGTEGWYLKTKANVADLRALYVKVAPTMAPSLSDPPAPSREPGEEG